MSKRVAQQNSVETLLSLEDLRTTTEEQVEGQGVVVAVDCLPLQMVEVVVEVSWILGCSWWSSRRACGKD